MWLTSQRIAMNEQFVIARSEATNQSRASTPTVMWSLWIASPQELLAMTGLYFGSLS
jgi:hypothetical protein